MGTKNNVNPNHYKEDGREPPGQDINQEINKQKYTQSKDRERVENRQGPPEFTPGTALDESKASRRGRMAETGQAIESSDSSKNR